MDSITSGIDPGALARLKSWADGIDVPMAQIKCVEPDRYEFVSVNPALSSAVKLPPDHFSGRETSALFPPRVAQRLQANLDMCRASETSVSFEECFFLDGMETWWHTTLSKPDGFDGKVILIVMQNISDRKAREFAMAEAIADLTSRFDELRLFSTMAAHDARSPLATVSSLMDLVLEDFMDIGDGKVELLRLCSKTVDNALDQITTTLERGRALKTRQLATSQVNFGRLCEDIATMVDPEMQLEIAAPEVHVECDEVVLQMGLRNLMSNAARFCERRISIEVHPDSDRGTISVDVADDGPGLPSGMTVDDLIRQGESRDGAHGFGLASVAKLLQSRGGSFDLITHDRAAMSGARFRMTLTGSVLDTNHGAKAGALSIRGFPFVAAG